MKRQKILFALIIGFLCLVSGCGGGGAGGPVIPSDEITQVATYVEIPDDFTLIYDFSDQNASPAYRLILTFLKSGTLNYEKDTVVGAGFAKETESATLSEADVLALFNYVVSKGFVTFQSLYETPDQSIPITSINMSAKDKNLTVNYQPCTDCVADNPPAEFNEITTFVRNMASKYLTKM